MSKPEQNEQVFTGTSNNGNLQEALDAAVARIGHGGPWRLAAIDGVEGIVSQVNVRIFAVAGAPAADGQERPGQPGEGETLTTLQGTVEEIPEGTLSICQDGAEYELVTQTAEGEERLRLRPVSGRAGSVLRRYAGTGEEVSVTGVIRHVECTVMDVTRARPVSAAAEADADGAGQGRPGQPGEGETLTTLQGTVEEIPEGTLSICQDGAEYELVRQTAEGEERLRLRPVSGHAGSVLRRHAGTGEQVSVTGYVRTVECTRMDVTEARPVPAAAGAAQG
ncbi:MAG TPA: hypothetical protein VHG08_26060 [Longimicrobium sp.]|nr:hypothetical protein [Longimicrobium sp.]